MKNKTEEIESYPNLLQENKLNFSGHDQTALKAWRSHAFTQYQQQGLPTRKNDAWKYTPIQYSNIQYFSPIIEKESKGARKLIAKHLDDDPQPSHIFFLYNGHYIHSADTLNLPFQVENVASVLHDLPSNLRNFYSMGHLDKASALEALNCSASQDGFYINIPNNTSIEKPICLYYITNPTSSSAAVHPRNFIFVGKNSKVSIIEKYIGRGEEHFLSNAFTYLQCDENSIVSHCSEQEATSTGIQLSSLSVKQHAESQFQSYSFNFGGNLSRTEIDIQLSEPAAKCQVYALQYTRSTENHDTYLTIHHRAPRCESTTIARGIMSDKSHGAFAGKITVHPYAEQTNARLDSKNLLLSKQAQASGRPQFEIYNDNVQCAHGVTIGNLDQDILFYMGSRGIPILEAQKMLIKSFISPVLTPPEIDWMNTHILNNISEL